MVWKVIGFASVAALGALPLVNALLDSLQAARLRAKAAKLLKVDGEEISVKITGDPASDYTVVLDAGLGMSSLSWHWVQKEVSNFARVVSIDRPGLGTSPPARKSGWLRRVDSIVSQMHSVLQAIGVTKKLVLVGHSTSGMHARLYTHLYPDEVAGLVLVDTAHEGQLSKLEGNSIYNSYPSAPATEYKLARLRRLWYSGLFRIMFTASSPAFARACYRFPPLTLVLRFLDWFGRASAMGIWSTIRMLGPHFPKEHQQQFLDEQCNLHGMMAMIAEHGSQRPSMEYMQSLNLMQPGILGERPLTVVNRDPAKGAGGRLYPNARGDPTREKQHEEFQKELAALSSSSKRIVVEGAGHGSLLFVQQDAKSTAKAIIDHLASLRS